MILTGRAVGLIALGTAAGIVLRNPWLIAIWAGLVLLAAFADWLFLPKDFQITRTPLPSVRLTQGIDHTFLLTNTGSRRIRGSVRDTWQPSAGAAGNIQPVDLPAGRHRDLQTHLQPERRGHLHAHTVTLRSHSALGLARRQTTVPAPAQLRVLPEFASRRHLPSRLARLRELDGQTSLLVRGEGTEFDSLRDYVDGDDVRSLDWRASARKQDLVVRTWRPERDRRVLLFLDTSRLAAARLESGTRLDASIEAALLLAALADQAGDRVEAIAGDNQIRARVSENRGPATVAAFAEAFGPLEPFLTEPDWPLIIRTITSQVTGRALVVLCTAVDPSSLTNGMITAAHTLATRHQVIIASATDPREEELTEAGETLDEVYLAAAASAAQAERVKVARLLSMGGVHVIQAAPEALAPQVADRYLELKAAGKL